MSQQPQEKPQVVERDPLSQPQPPHKIRIELIIALIGLASAVIVAIISYILPPIINARLSPTVTSTPGSSATTSPAIYPPSGWQPILNDALNFNDGNWSAISDSGNSGTCGYVGDVYQVSESTLHDTFYPCYAERTDLTDMAFEVQMTITKGDRGGITFRDDTSSGNFYHFWISQGGLYALDTYENDNYTGTLNQGRYS